MVAGEVFKIAQSMPMFARIVAPIRGSCRL
jgi:hypothetical protein